METTQKVRAGIEAIPHLSILGEPNTSVVAFSSKKFSIYGLVDLMNKLGWALTSLQNPAG